MRAPDLILLDHPVTGGRAHRKSLPHAAPKPACSTKLAGPESGHRAMDLRQSVAHIRSEFAEIVQSLPRYVQFLVGTARLVSSASNAIQGDGRKCSGRRTWFHQSHAWQRDWRAIAGVASFSAVEPALAQSSVKIGYALSLTGPNAGGAAITTLPNYELWVKEVNAAGGLKLGDKRVPIEVIAVRRPLQRGRSRQGARPADQPGQGRFHPAALGHRPESRRRADLQQGRLSASGGDRGHRPRARAGKALAEQFLAARHQRGRGQRAGRVAGQAAHARQDRQHGRHGQRRRRLRHRPFGRGAAGLAKASFKLAYDKTYPVGTQDFSQLVNEAKALNPDVFIAFSYPPDTLGITEQARDRRLQSEGLLHRRRHRVSALQAAVRRQRRRRDGHRRLERRRPAIKDYLARHGRRRPTAPSRIAGRARSPMPACRCCSRRSNASARSTARQSSRSCRPGPSTPSIGKIKLENNVPTKFWWVGQWQGGEFYGVGPATTKARARRSCRSRHGRRRDRRIAAAGLNGMTNAIFTGLMLGGMYALVAMGLTLQYGVARIMNLSYGEFLVAASFAPTGCSPAWRSARCSGWRSSFPLGFVASWLIYRVLLTPLVRRAPDARRARSRLASCPPSA